MRSSHDDQQQRRPRRPISVEVLRTNTVPCAKRGACAAGHGGPRRALVRGICGLAAPANGRRLRRPPWATPTENFIGRGGCGAPARDRRLSHRPAVAPPQPAHARAAPISTTEPQEILLLGGNLEDAMRWTSTFSFSHLCAGHFGAAETKQAAADHPRRFPQPRGAPPTTTRRCWLASSAEPRRQTLCRDHCNRYRGHRQTAHRSWPACTNAGPGQ